MFAPTFTPVAPQPFSLQISLVKPFSFMARHPHSFESQLHFSFSDIATHSSLKQYQKKVATNAIWEGNCVHNDMKYILTNGMGNLCTLVKAKTLLAYVGTSWFTFVHVGSSCCKLASRCVYVVSSWLEDVQDGLPRCPKGSINSNLNKSRYTTALLNHLTVLLLKWNSKQQIYPQTCALTTISREERKGIQWIDSTSITLQLTFH